MKKKAYLATLYWELTKSVVRRSHAKSYERLCQTARRGNLGKLKILANQGSNIGVIDKCLMKVLYWAAYGKDSANSVDLLLKSTAINVWSKPVSFHEYRPGQFSARSTPLHFAVSGNNVDMVKFLLEKDVDISTTDSDGETPLHLAVRENSYEILELLLEKGVDINCQGSAGGLGCTALHTAVATKNIKTMKWILKKGADVNIVDWVEKTPLHWAATFGDLKMVALLLKKRINTNAEDIDGATALNLAKKNDVRELLKSHGAIEKAR